MNQTVDVTFPQSLAQHDDRLLIGRALGQLENPPVRVDCRRLTDGYSGSRLYLAQRTIFPDTQAPQPWVLKVGPLEEMKAEHRNWETAAGFIPPNNRIGISHVLPEGQTGVLIMDYASFGGHTPRTLEEALRTTQARGALDHVLKAMTSWNPGLKYQQGNIAAWLHTWCLSKVEALAAEWGEIGRF